MTSVLVVGVSASALWIAALMYALRMFAITGFYHRYFSHRSFKTSRVGQFVFGVIGVLPTMLVYRFGTVLRAIVACGWFGIQTYIGGSAIYAVVRVFAGVFDGISHD